MGQSPEAPGVQAAAGINRKRPRFPEGKRGRPVMIPARGYFLYFSLDRVMVLSWMGLWGFDAILKLRPKPTDW